MFNETRTELQGKIILEASDDSYEVKETPTKQYTGKKDEPQTTFKGTVVKGRDYTKGPGGEEGGPAHKYPLGHGRYRFKTDSGHTGKINLDVNRPYYHPDGGWDSSKGARVGLSMPAPHGKSGWQNVSDDPEHVNKSFTTAAKLVGKEVPTDQVIQMSVQTSKQPHQELAAKANIQKHFGKTHDIKYHADTFGYNKPSDKGGLPNASHDFTLVPKDHPNRGKLDPEKAHRP